MSLASVIPPPNPPTIAGRYEVVARLAQGGMGEVFHVRERESGRDVALKRLLSPAERARALFQAEYHALARLRHPYIVEVFDYGLDGATPYYTMELLSGTDLRECAPASIRDACLHLRDVASSLALLHAQRLVHRDISPRNVRRTEGGRCKLFDFGTMVPFGIPPNVAGTSPFISPEAWDGAQLDQRSDLYSLGALGYWLISGQLHAPPRPLERRRAERVVPTRLARVVPAVPSALDELIMALLEPDPSKRPWSAHEVITQLSAIGGLTNDDAHSLAHSHLGSSRMIGRRRELRLASRAMKDAQQYEGKALLVEGAPGVGKSRYLQELAWLGQTHGLCVVRGYGAHAQGPLGLTSQLYQQLTRAVPNAAQRLSASERASLQRLDESQSGQAVTYDARAALQWALTAYVRAVTRELALLVVVDDLDAADEFSRAFVGSLAHIAHTRPLIVVASRTQGLERPDPADEAFARIAAPITLEPLSGSETRSLIGDALGRPASYARYADWVYRKTHGNPAATLTLTAWLLQEGVIGYVNGGFVLPEGDVHAELTDTAQSPDMLRLTNLPETSRHVLETVALCRSGARLELCLAATSADHKTVLGALDELVRAGILVGATHSYVFAQAGVRTLIAEQISPERAQEIHLLLADARLAGEDQSLASRLEAGYHLLHTPRALAGALLLAEVCPPIIEAGLEPGPALDALERALAELERHPHTLTRRLHVRTLLARSSYLHDYRLALRHEAKTIEELTRWNGLWHLRSLTPLFGGLLVAALCFCFVLVRRFLRPARDRGPGPYESMQLMARALVSYVGVHALATDGASGALPLSYLSALRAIPAPSSGRCVYLTSAALSLQAFGREVELERAIAVALRALEQNRLFDMTEAEQRDMRVGLMLSRSINECYRLGSRALEMADQLEAEDTPLARASAYRVRYAYYVSRGMVDKAERFRQKLEVHGIQGGTTWQLEWFAAPLTGIASVYFGDLVGATQAGERLERLSREIPSLKSLLELVRVGQHFLKGELAAAVAGGERWVRHHPPRSVIGWGAGHALYALALNRVGRHADALRVCEDALAPLGPEDEEYIIMYGSLWRERIAALGGLGRAEEALAFADDYSRRMESAREHALIAHVEEMRGNLARSLQNHPMLAQSLVRMREAADRSGSSAIIQRAGRLARLTARATDDLLALALPHTDQHTSAPPTSDAPPNADRAATPRRGIRVSKRRSLLRRVMDHAGARGAMLYGRPTPGGVPPLLASAGDEPPLDVGEVEARGLWEEALTAPVEAPLMAARSLPHPELGDARNFGVIPIYAPGERVPVAILLLVTERTTPVDVPPTTWLSELAQRAQTAQTETSERHTGELVSEQHDHDEP